MMSLDLNVLHRTDDVKSGCKHPVLGESGETFGGKNFDEFSVDSTVYIHWE